MRRPIRRDPPATAPSADPAAIDALYGLEPVIEPGAPGAELSDFVTIDCPYCGEQYGTPVDLTGGDFRYVEDCQVCCQPIEVSGEVTAEGSLTNLSAGRLD